MTINLPQINCPARAAARAEHVKPGRPCDQRGPERRRPQDVPAGGQLLIQAFDNGLRLGARGGIGNVPLRIDGNVQAPRPHAHAAVGGDLTEQRYQQLRKPGYPPTFEEFLLARDPVLEVKVRLNMIIKAFDNQVVGQHLNGMFYNVLDLTASHKRLLTSDRPLSIYRLKEPSGFLFLPISSTKLYVAANTSATLDEMANANALNVVIRSNQFVVTRARRFVWARDPWENDFIRKYISSNMEPSPIFPGLGNYDQSDATS
jgi:hypothetical protein